MNSNYNYINAFGDGKLHGLYILFKNHFSLLHSLSVNFDNDPSWPLSRKTNNIGLIAVLNNVNDQSQGVIIATCHLFWHPAYIYERTRQSYILFKSCVDLRNKLNVNYPIIVSGDFNTEPHECLYSMIVGDHINNKEKTVCSIIVLHSLKYFFSN